jgi:protein-S-isoprenylcysteine O-methyltransferase Ste14
MILPMAYRLIGKEKLLLEELEGYKEYQQMTKYRLIPGIW